MGEKGRVGNGGGMKEEESDVGSVAGIAWLSIKHSTRTVHDIRCALETFEKVGHTTSLETQGI